MFVYNPLVSCVVLISEETRADKRLRKRGRASELEKEGYGLCSGEGFFDPFM